MNKTDFLRECMSDPALISQPIPIDQFSRSYCVVCSNKECCRSRANTMIFPERVQSWKLRLFDDVPRASDDDKNFEHIRAKNFQSTNEQAAVQIIQNQELPKETSPPVIEAKLEVVVSKEEPLQEISTKTPIQQSYPTIDNTPMQGGIMIPGKPNDNEKDKFINPGDSFVFEEPE